jgi:hypothetical protein
MFMAWTLGMVWTVLDVLRVDGSTTVRCNDISRAVAFVQLSGAAHISAFACANEVINIAGTVVKSKMESIPSTSRDVGTVPAALWQDCRIARCEVLLEPTPPEFGIGSKLTVTRRAGVC